MNDHPTEVSRLIDYEALTLQAMRDVARNALRLVSKEGLPGDHHFFIEFDTSAAGVVVPEFLRNQYPERMTIVLQHQFSGLEVEAEQFQVGLAFGGVPASLTVPFSALTAFMDPAAHFAVRFAPEAPKVEKASSEETETGDAPATASASTSDSTPDQDGVVSLEAFRSRRGKPPTGRGRGDPA